MKHRVTECWETVRKLDISVLSGKCRELGSETLSSKEAE